MRRVVRTAAFFALLLAAWEIAARAAEDDAGLLPPPSAVGRYLVDAARDGTLAEAAVVTLRRLAVGYLFGLACGLPFGFLTAAFRGAADTLGVVALGLQTLPSVCWAPLAILWFGQTETAMFFIVVMGTLWSIQLATHHGVRSVPPIYSRAARTMGSRRLHTAFFVTLPASLPYIVGGMKQGWAFAWRSLMAAEIYVTILTGFGLGHLLHYGRELHRMEQVLGVMLVIVLVGLGVDRLVFGPAERFLHRRWGTGGV
ncbi:MAG TPA: ABC transporter permease [Planctomycetota bacterium]|nr:ABC transporter permease [Planctomycetota bacterium]